LGQAAKGDLELAESLVKLGRFDEALETLRECDKTAPVLVTKDAALRIKGAQLGVAVQDYRADTVPVEQLQSGLIEHFTEGEVIDRLFEEGKIELHGVEAEVNQFIVLKAGTSHSALARVIRLPMP